MTGQQNKLNNKFQVEDQSFQREQAEVLIEIKTSEKAFNVSVKHKAALAEDHANWSICLLFIIRFFCVFFLPIKADKP